LAARDNHFHFGEALLCVNGFGAADGWRRAVSWRGQGNHYRGPGDWLCVDGRPAGLRGLPAWQKTWGAEADAVVVP
jgi:hypothetical protein